MNYLEVIDMIKKYTRNKRFIKRIDNERLVIETKYFGPRSSSVLGTPGGPGGESAHTPATLGQDKLDELNNKYGIRYKSAVDSIAYVDALLERLPDDVKDMIIHTYINKQYVDEIASRYRCTRATIYNRMNAAIKYDCELLD